MSAELGTLQCFINLSMLYQLVNALSTCQCFINLSMLYQLVNALSTCQCFINLSMLFQLVNALSTCQHHPSVSFMSWSQSSNHPLVAFFQLINSVLYQRVNIFQSGLHFVLYVIYLPSFSQHKNSQILKCHIIWFKIIKMTSHFGISLI